MSTPIIVALIPYIVPMAFMGIIYLYHTIIIHLPEQQRTYIESFAATAVQMVEQRFEGRTGDEKKAIAMDALQGFFKAFKLPTPEYYILNSFIESAVLEMNRIKPTPLQGGKI